MEDWSGDNASVSELQTASLWKIYDCLLLGLTGVGVFTVVIVNAGTKLGRKDSCQHVMLHVGFSGITSLNTLG